MKKFTVFFLLLVLIAPVALASQPGDDWFLIDAQSAEDALRADNALPYLKDSFSQHLLDHPMQTLFFAAELNLNNGDLGWGTHKPVGERYMFGTTVNASTVRDIYDVDKDTVLTETLRLLFGPWYSSKAYTRGYPKNLGWFPYHLDLLTGEWIKVDPRSPDLGIRIYHYTDYYHRNRTTTFGVFFNRDCEVEGNYWCKLTIIRKTKT